MPAHVTVMERVLNEVLNTYVKIFWILLFGQCMQKRILSEYIFIRLKACHLPPPPPPKTTKPKTRTKERVADHSCVLICTKIDWATFGGWCRHETYSRKITRRLSCPALRLGCSDLYRLVNGTYTFHRLSSLLIMWSDLWPGLGEKFPVCLRALLIRLSGQQLQGRVRCIWLLF